MRINYQESTGAFIDVVTALVEKEKAHGLQVLAKLNSQTDVINAAKDNHLKLEKVKEMLKSKP